MFKRTIILTAFSLLLFTPGFVQSADLAFVIQGGLRLQHHQNPLLLEEGLPVDGQSFTGVGLSLGALMGLQLSSRVSVAAQLDVGEILLTTLRRNSTSNKFSVFANDFLLNREGSESSAGWLLEESMFLRELYVTLLLNKKGWHRLHIGQRHATIASSALFDGYAIGIFLEADMRKRRYSKRKPLYLKLSIFLPDSSWTRQGKLSPTAYISLLYDKSWLQFEIHGAYMYDGGGTTARMLWPALQRNVASFRSAGIAPSCMLRSVRCETMPESSGHHVWAGATMRVGARPNHRGIRLFATALGYGGSFQVKLPELPDQLTGFGVFLDAGISLSHNRFSAKLNMMYSMGAEEGTGPNGYLHGFRAIAPQLGNQHIMQPGGLSRVGAKRTLGLAQLSNGYWGIQYSMGYETQRADFRVSVAGYGSDFNKSTRPQPANAEVQSSLDIEINARASVDINSGFRLLGQFDIFLPGGYLIDRSRAPMFRLWMGFDFSLRSW